MLIIFFHEVADIVANAIRQEKKGIQKGKLQIPLLVEHIIVYVENMTESTKMVLEMSLANLKDIKTNIKIICSCT